MRALSYAVTFAVLAGLPFAAADAQSLVNDDVIDLYDRVPVGTKVVVKQAPTL